jgi:8-oxo-dGTP diphosphatase
LPPQNLSMGAFVAILNPRNEVLCVQQAYAEHNWTTPGGQIEDGEDPIQAVMRETREEVGIDISNLTFSGLYWKSYAKDLVFSFVATSDLDEFNFKSNPEISQAAFFDPEMLPSPMAKNTQVRIRDASMRAAPRLTIFLTPDQYITR